MLECLAFESIIALMKLILAITLFVSSVQSSSAIAFKTLAIDLRSSNLLFCYAGYEHSSLESTVAIVNYKRYNNRVDGHKIPENSGVSAFLEKENIKAYHTGKSLKNQKKNEDICDKYSLERVRELAIATDNEDFIRLNPQEFDKYSTG